MMSAKTVLTETPAASTTPAVPGIAGNAAAADGVPSEFQNLLAGAVPVGVAPAEVDMLPMQPLMQPLMQLMSVKQQQLAAKLATDACIAPGAQAVRVSPAKPAVAPDLLKILDAGAALLPEGLDAEAAATAELPEDSQDSDEPVAADADILSDWLDAMVPTSVFATQAGSPHSTGDELASGENGGIAVGREAAPTPGSTPRSLVLQAGMPTDALDTGVPSAQGTGTGTTFAIQRDVSAAAQNPIAAFSAALAQTTTETGERDTPASDNWMSAMGELSGKRAPEAAMPAVEGRLQTPVHDARWADALAHRLVLMARDGESMASLKLVPVDLGPLDIQISVRDGEANVHFGAAHAETRAVLEASLPRLRELLGAQGLQLANASVSHQSGGQNRPERGSGNGALSGISEDSEVASAKVISTSLLDIYA
jgi:flagellar hook-length control protein FliK